MMKQNAKLQRAWIWNRNVAEFVRERVRGYSLNVCSGLNGIGDVKVDFEPKEEGILKSTKDIIKNDMKNLQFGDNTFDTVISDPPWEVGYYDRWKPFFECVRVCREGGLIIYNAYWIPESKLTQLKEVWIRQDGAFTNCSVISIHEKIREGNLEDFIKEETNDA